jgi:hypothetical protein
VQLANNIQPLKRTICDAISAHSDIAYRALREQWRHLILDPLSNIGGGNEVPRYILVIDALDECEGENNVGTIVRLLAEVQSLETVQLRVFLTSRPEVPIRNSFTSVLKTKHRYFALHQISLEIVNHDIRTFLEHKLGFIARQRPKGTGSSELIIERLVYNAHGLFIWAETAYRFICAGRSFAPIRLDTILKQDSTTIDGPVQRLDKIYTTVLRHCISSEYSPEEAVALRCMLRNMLGSIVTLFSPLNTRSLSKLLGTSQDDVRQTLNDLHAIMDIPADPTLPLHLHHPSFRDFLLDERRCKDSDFLIHEKQAHRQLATQCLQLMGDVLKQDICGVDQPGLLVTDVTIGYIEQHLPPDIQYACLYWVQHFQRAGFELNDGKMVHRFLLQHFLHWLEALGWVGKVRDGVNAIISLGSMATVSWTA